MRCELCDKDISELAKSCDHEKNGYCAVFLMQAKQDAIEVGMHPRREPNYDIKDDLNDKDKTNIIQPQTHEDKLNEDKPEL